MPLSSSWDAYERMFLAIITRYYKMNHIKVNCSSCNKEKKDAQTWNSKKYTTLKFRH